MAIVNKQFEDFVAYDPHQLINCGHNWLPEKSNMYKVNDVIKFSNTQLVHPDIINKKFLITERLVAHVSMISLDEDEIALNIDYQTVQDLGGAKIGYRRQKAVGFWASLRKDPEYEIINLANEKNIDG